MHRAVGGCASGLRGGAEVCGGGSRSSAGMCCEVGEECIVAARGSGSVREGSEKVLGEGVSLCGGGDRSSAGNGW